MARLTSTIATLDIDGRTVPLEVRRNARAKRLIMRIDKTGDGVVVTIPVYLEVADAVAMARRKAGWIAARLARLPDHIPFTDGQVVPFMGERHAIRHDPSGGVPVARGNGEIVIAGRPEHLARRVTDWLKAEARREIAARARDKAMRLGRPCGRIGVREVRSRWGSCSSAGNLSFSWRLILAPPFVLDYVVAHEVAHLEVADHGPRFWRVVETLTAESAAAKTWLRRNGVQLHRYG